eukprot:TRINITY_DN18336_c0_g1_i1.p1 TRINITY_DN18336_c0_g1~~TRINITY_DN18336_c0_g1_i1.p1  ORF type:complete len:120 (-),score=3.33 TRINITY_DN18336_c0_g1_i1:469-828(-)
MPMRQQKLVTRIQLSSTPPTSSTHYPLDGNKQPASTTCNSQLNAMLTGCQSPSKRSAVADLRDAYALQLCAGCQVIRRRTMKALDRGQGSTDIKDRSEHVMLRLMLRLQDLAVVQENFT